MYFWNQENIARCTLTCICRYRLYMNFYLKCFTHLLTTLTYTNANTYVHTHHTATFYSTNPWDLRSWLLSGCLLSKIKNKLFNCDTNYITFQTPCIYTYTNTYVHINMCTQTQTANLSLSLSLFCLLMQWCTIMHLKHIFLYILMQSGHLSIHWHLPIMLSRHLLHLLLLNAHSKSKGNCMYIFTYI